MTNETTKTFDYPSSLIYEGKYWYILLRRAQVTLGSLVLATKGDEIALSDLSVESYIEMKEMISRIESVLKNEYKYEKINYMALMMRDPHVHFHIFPRYSSPKSFEGIEFKDSGWPKLPDLFSPTVLDDDMLEKFTQYLSSKFEK